MITERHEELARFSTIAMVGFGLLGIGALAVFRGRALPRWVMAAGFAFALAIAGLMGATANSGGQIRHTEIRPSGVAAGGGNLIETDEHYGLEQHQR